MQQQQQSDRKRPDKSRRLHAPHFKHLATGGYTSTMPGRNDDYNPQKASMVRKAMSTNPLDGTIIDWEKKDLDAKTIADSIEMMNPLIRPYGCGPVAPQNHFVLRTYDRIIEIRNESRMDNSGRAIGDRTFKRCYQQAMRDIARYNTAPDDLKKAADKAGKTGVFYLFERNSSTGELITKAGGADGKQLIPKIKASTKEGEIVDGVLRSPAMAVQKAFEYLTDKHWHRYLFPFGCFYYTDPKKTEGGWKEWMADMKRSRNEEAVINPYSVTAADVLYLCNTTGYLERFVFIIGVILWAKEYGYNLLRYHRPRSSDQELRMFVTLERHMHLFGSIHMHRRVLESSKNDVGGNWSEMLELLDRLETKCGQEFGVQKNSLMRHFDNMIINSLRGNASALQTPFPQAGRISDRRS